MPHSALTQPLPEWKAAITHAKTSLKLLAHRQDGRTVEDRFRNVTSPIQYIVETYVDDGYLDLKKLMGTLADVDIRGILIADQLLRIVGYNRTGRASSIGYISGLYDVAARNAAEDNVGCES